MLKKIIDWLSGKKTIIGLIGLNVMQLDLDYWLQMNQDLYTLLFYAFGALAAGGLAHKGFKEVTKKK